jgi:hypothetical protein
MPPGADYASGLPLASAPLSQTPAIWLERLVSDPPGPTLLATPGSVGQIPRSTQILLTTDGLFDAPRTESILT